MKREEKEWLDSIRDRMDSYEESVPEGLWDDISSAVQTPKGHGTLRPWFWRSIAAAAAVAAGVFAVLRFTGDTSQTNINNNSVVSQGELLSSAPKPSSSVYAEEQDSPEKECAVVSQSGPSVPVAQAAVMQLLTEDETWVDAGIASAPADSENSEKKDTVISRPSEPEVYVPSSVSSHEGEDWSDRMEVSEPARGIRVTGKPSDADIALSGAATHCKDVSVFDPSHLYRGVSSSELASATDDGSLDGETTSQSARMAPVGRMPSVTNTARHERPIRAELTARWKFGNVLGLESGLAWTVLRSKFTTESGQTVSQDKQTLQYLGIPLDLTADFWNTSRFSFYGSFGGMVEKCVAGTVRTEDFVGEDRISSETSSITVDPLLWSLNAAAGAQVNFLKSFGFYIEPGLSYHFDDGSDVQTGYKERPLDFVLTFGLRVSFK